MSQELNVPKQNHPQALDALENDRSPSRDLSYTQMVADIELSDRQLPLQAHNRQDLLNNPDRSNFSAAQPGCQPSRTANRETSSNELVVCAFEEGVKKSKRLSGERIQELGARARQDVGSNQASGEGSNLMQQARGYYLIPGLAAIPEDDLYCQTKKLGQKVVQSQLKEPYPGTIIVEQRSEVLDQESVGRSLSHFQPVNLEDCGSLFGAKGFNSKGNDYIILTTPINKEQESQFQQKFKKQDSPIELRQSSKQEALPNNLKHASPQLLRNKSQQKPFQMNKGHSNLTLDPKELQSKEIMLESRIIRRTLVENPVKDHNRFTVKQMEGENRMKLTQDPKIRESEFKAVANGGNLSEPNRHSIKQADKNKNKKECHNFADGDSLQKESEQEQEHISAKVILEKLNKLENAMIMMVEHSERPSQQSDRRASPPPLHLNRQENQQRPTRQKILSMNRMIPQQLLDQNLSSIEEKAEVEKPLPKLPSKNSELNREIIELKKRIRELEKLQVEKQPKSKSRDKRLRRVTSSDEHYNRFRGGNEHNFQVIPPQTSLGMMLPRQNSGNYRNDQSSELTVSLEQFQELQHRLPYFDRIPSIEASRNKLGDVAFKIFGILGYDVENYGGFEIIRSSSGIEFELNRGPTLVWSAKGYFYLGNTRMRKGSLEKEGKGIMFVPNRYIYEGDFKKDAKHGFGIMVQVVTGQKYKGFWKDDLYNGRGKLYTSESRYDGYFANGLQEGEGFELLSNGDTYEGEYRAGKYHGRGRYIWKKNKSSYEGDFKSGYMEGEGVWKNSKGDTYEGQYYKGMKHGLGIYRWSDGRVFKGMYEHGHRVSHRSPERRIIEPERTLTEDLNQSSEFNFKRVETFRSLDKKKNSSNFPDLNERKYFHSPFRRI